MRRHLTYTCQCLSIVTADVPKCLASAGQDRLGRERQSQPAIIGSANWPAQRRVAKGHSCAGLKLKRIEVRLLDMGVAPAGE